jgi:anhydro-N-acetylmuramic acid kinase
MTELTAKLVAQAIAGFTEKPHEVVLTGGGAMNIHLAGRIRKLLSPSSTYTVEKYGFGIRAKQAACYAVLAAARMDGIAAHCTQATGAKRAKVLGTVTMG